MTKSEALSFADGSVNKLARILKISHSAVSNWNDDKIPELRAYQLREYHEQTKKKRTNHRSSI